MTGYPVRRAHQLEERPVENRWLIEEMWSEQAVGIIGGQPKCCKSFLALDMAVAVASGAPFLRQYEVRHTGSVLLFSAEDALHVVRERIEGIAEAAGVSFEALDIFVITRTAIRLDIETERRQLTETVEQLKPKLIILDPFVRLHRVDENAAGDVAPLLQYLRRLQRQFAASVVLVHHARKSAHVRDGQALRGSSELHAWGDSNLYLRWKRDDLILSVEHRAAPIPKPSRLELVERGAALALELGQDREADSSPAPIDPTDRIEYVLRAAGGPLSVRAIRAECRMRMQTVVGKLNALVEAGRVIQTTAGYKLVA